MFPELSIERIIHREIDSLPLPPESSWVPNGLSMRRSMPLTALPVVNSSRPATGCRRE